MEDDPRAAHNSFQGFVVEYIYVMELEICIVFVVNDIVLLSSIVTVEIIASHDAIPVSKEPIYKMASNEAGSASNNNFRFSQTSQLPFERSIIPRLSMRHTVHANALETNRW
jgi:hypothetical protein